MVARGMGRLILGLLLAWSIAPAGARSFAAEDPTQVEPLRPIPQTKSTFGEPLDSDCLGLLESPDEQSPFQEEPTWGAANGRLDGDSYLGGVYLDDDALPRGGAYPGGGGVEFCGESYCHPPERFWLRGEYLLMWTNGSRVGPLVTTSPVGTPIGVLGPSTTTVLFGNERVNREGRSNFRVGFGYWVDPCRTHAWEGDYFDSRDYTTAFSRLSPGVPVLARPFRDAVTGLQSSQIIAYPGRAVGDVDIHASTYFESAGLRWRYNILQRQASVLLGCGEYDSCEPGGTGSCQSGSCQSGCSPAANAGRGLRVDVVAGYRYHRLADQVSIRENVIIANPELPVNVNATMFNIEDGFRTTNEFNGGELGLVTQLLRGRWSFEFMAKLALGNNHQTVIIEGSTGITVPGQSTTTHSSGILALPTNIGNYTQNDFVVVPQFSAEVGYRVTRGLRAYLGYNWLYWANVARAGDQIDMTLNPSQFPPGALSGPARPAFTFNAADFWAQGFTGGFEFSF